MNETIQKAVLIATKDLEKQIDAQMDRLDNLDADELRLLKEKRLQELKRENKQKAEWLANGHGTYTELADEKEFFEISKKSPDIVCHFYRNTSERCRIVDKHLNILANKHIEAKFCKVNAEKCPFLAERLRIKIIPTIALIKDRKTKDYIVGFTDLGNRDDFNTEMMEWRIAQSGAINYDGDLTTPPSLGKKKPPVNTHRSIRDGYDFDGSDLDELED
uniref:Thioredoxin domain-containing protein 9 n=1 Tax=Tabanus bromius TaxID=304241 RepID=A0A0K8TQ53_TABBR